MHPDKMNDVPRGTIKFQRVDHGPVKWSKRRVILVAVNHGRDEVLAERIVNVADCEQDIFHKYCGDILSFVLPLVPEKFRAKHRYAFIVQAPALDLFGEACWDDVSVAWL